METAKALLAQGATVVGASRRASPIEHPSFIQVQGDLTDSAVKDKVVEACGPILDGVVFNAGVFSTAAKLEHADVDSWRKLFEVNLFSGLGLLKDLIPALRAAKGRAIFVSSGAAKNVYQAWGAYGASKAALNVVANTLAIEEPDVISVAVAPGAVDTPMQDDIRGVSVKSGEMSLKDSEKFVALKTEGKLVKAEDSGRMYANLALRASPVINGLCLRYSDDLIAPYLTNAQ